MKKKQSEFSWWQDLLLNIFVFIGLFGWFLAIWIPSYRWRIFFTCIVSLILAGIFYGVKKS